MLQLGNYGKMAWISPVFQESFIIVMLWDFNQSDLSWFDPIQRSFPPPPPSLSTATCSVYKPNFRWVDMEVGLEILILIYYIVKWHDATFCWYLNPHISGFLGWNERWISAMDWIHNLNLWFSVFRENL